MVYYSSSAREKLSPYGAIFLAKIMKSEQLEKMNAHPHPTPGFDFGEQLRRIPPFIVDTQIYGLRGACQLAIGRFQFRRRGMSTRLLNKPNQK
jgi:hypothetical protein